MAAAADPGRVAETYFTSWAGKDFDTLRSLLADEVTFRGALGTADGADACMQGLRGLGELITEIAVEHRWVDGPDVITWFDLHTTLVDPIPTVNWSHVEAGRITAIRVTFDPRDLVAAMENSD